MKLPAFITTFFGAPAAPASDKIYVVPNEHGGFSLRDGDGTVYIGNYHSAERAMRVAEFSGFKPELALDKEPERQIPRGALRYVIMRERNGGERIFCCLPPAGHFELAQNCHRSSGGTPVSAGLFTFLPDGSVETFGESTGLHLRPRDQDAQLIMEQYRASVARHPAQQLQYA